MGLPSELIDDRPVGDALRRTHLADFLAQFREEIDTNIGERGIRLSGGHQQRLGIARALYARPKLLILDEVTSALDSETEQAIIEMLNELESEVTTVTVAHRLATGRRADPLINLKDGRSIIQGTFEEVRALAPDFDRQAALLGL
jgi:ABC-type multidrug transport system fused ATPase/permease subunit